MNTGKTLFAQLMDFLPWTTFARYVARYGGDKGVRSLTCAEQFRVMAFAQLTYRESLRDIEVCLSAQDAKLYHMGFREPIRRSMLADANELRDWRIHADFAQRLIGQAGRFMPARTWDWHCRTPFMRSTPQPSTCACRFSRGLTSAQPKPQ